MESARAIKGPLRDPWNSGHIAGYMCKQKAGEMLLQQPTSAMLMRFPESASGAHLTFAIKLNKCNQIIKMYFSVGS